MPSVVDSDFAAWLRSPALFSSTANGSLPAGLDPSARESEVVSPMIAKATADAEGARQMAILGAPLALDRHVVKGHRKDLIGKCVVLTNNKLGYDYSPNIVVNGDGSSGSVAGWVAKGAQIGGNNDGTLAIVGGKLRATQQSFGFIYSQEILTVPGRSYRLTGTRSALGLYYLGSSASGAAMYDILNNQTTGPIDFTFVAAGASVWLSIGHGNGIGNFVDFDDIAVQPKGGIVFVVEVDEQEDGVTVLGVIRKLG